MFEYEKRVPGSKSYFVCGNAAIITFSHSDTGPFKYVCKSAGSRPRPDVCVASCTSVIGGAPANRPSTLFTSGKYFSTGSERRTLPASTNCNSINPVNCLVIRSEEHTSELQSRV